MKQLFSILLVAGALAVSVPVAANAADHGTWGRHDDSNRGDRRDRGDRDGGYQDYHQQLVELTDWADQGNAEGLFSGKSKRNFYKEIAYCERWLQQAIANDGRIDRSEASYLDQRIGNLRNLMQTMYEQAQRQQGRSGRGGHGGHY